MGRKENIMTFEDSMRRCETDAELAAAVEASLRNQRVILETDEVVCEEGHRYSGPANVFVSSKRSFEAASAYTGKKVCVHNFASARTPGGGVLSGARAQEECLCRISSLYPAISSEDAMAKFYDPHSDFEGYDYNADCIFTPGVVVFKSDNEEPELLPREDRYSVDVITLAAPNIGGPLVEEGKVGMTYNKLLGIHDKRMRRFCDVAKQNGEEVLILGAFGCGAFCNPPEVVSLAMKNVINDYLYDFETIEFAIYCSSYETENYKVFKEVLG